MLSWSKRLTPVTLTASATLLDLQNLAQKVLTPYFHQNHQQPLKERANLYMQMKKMTLYSLLFVQILEII